MKRGVLLGVVLLVVPGLAVAQDRGREGGGGRPGGEHGGPPGGGQRPGGPGGGGPRPGPQVQPQRPGPAVQPARGGDAGRPGRPGGDVGRPGRPGGDRPGQPGGFDRPGGDRPGRPGGDFNRPGGDRPNRPGGDRPGGDRPGGSFDRPGGRPGGDFHRPEGYRPPLGYWRGNDWNRPRVRWSGYTYPRGYAYRRWSPGLFLPALFFSSAYFYDDYRSLGLYAPPYGYHWVRYGPDLLLVQNGTRRIVDVRYGVFD